jgi:protein involved in polysaccharide export with SLBB domain
VRTPLILIFSALLTATAGAQGQSSAATGTASGSATSLGGSSIVKLPGVEAPIISDKYYLAPGDRLQITVQGGVVYSYEAVVTYEGKVNVSIPVLDNREEVIDVIMVSGLTLAQAQDTLTATMGRYFKTAKVKLTLIGLRSGIVFLTGEVQNPGAYDALPVERVSQIIARAGGIAPLGTRTHIKLIRAGEVYSIVDIERFESKGDLLANPYVQSGDVIQVPAVEGLATVRGAVFGRGESRLRAPTALTPDATRERTSEGIYELTPGARVSDVISKAGGITPWADLSNSYINRLVVGGGGARKKIPIDLRRIIFEQDSAGNVDMANFDVVVVPAFDTLVYVEGEVTKPGPFPYYPSLRASDYIGQAGGPTTYANVRSMSVLHSGRRISGRTNPVAEPGDIVVVPRVGLKWWQDYVTIFGAVAVPVASLLVSLALANKL